jgi:hypothetical protein
MKNFFLFLATGIVTILPVLYMVAGAWMGVPVIPTEYASLIGSCLLIGAAFVSLFVHRRALILVGVGIACVGSFWIIEPIKALRSNGASITLLVILAIVWLMMALSLAAVVRGIRATDRQPISARFRKISLCISAVMALTLVIATIWQNEANKRTPSRYEIPEGYVGWIEIQYEIPGSPPTTIRDKQFIFSIPASGLLKTSTAQQFGEAVDHYFYCGTSGCRALTYTISGKDGKIWDESSGTSQETGKPEVRVEHFFVGTEAQYKKMQELSTMQDGIVPGDVRAKL